MSNDKQVLLYDPPSGWRYGFPRPYEPLEGESLTDTLLRDGYPQHEIDNGGAKYCRFIGGMDGEAQRHVEGANDRAALVARSHITNGGRLHTNDNAPPARTGDWMQTYTGRKFWPLDPKPDEIHIEDIAHALSMQCRYGGHSKLFYSVAEHSVLMARWVGDIGYPQHALWALLHDAAEAYLADVPRPLKRHLAGYKDAEDKVMAAVCERFGLEPDMPAIVHEADTRILADEIAQNMKPMDWHAKHDDPLGVTLRYWTPGEAEIWFLWTFRQLMDKREVGRAA